MEQKRGEREKKGNDCRRLSFIFRTFFSQDGMRLVCLSMLMARPRENTFNKTTHKWGGKGGRKKWNPAWIAFCTHKKAERGAASNSIQIYLLIFFYFPFYLTFSLWSEDAVCMRLGRCLFGWRIAVCSRFYSDELQIEAQKSGPSR